MASRFTRFLKSSTELQTDADGVVNCGEEPFRQLDGGSTWFVARPADEGDQEGEVSGDYLNIGSSLRGLTGQDGLESTMYYWALRKFVYELDRRANENLRSKFPAGKGELEWKDVESIVRVHVKIKDEMEEWDKSVRVQG
ncbi:hypothetical protein CYMTET_17261 [Cymbomonas tetramitiformis]|uniref:Uncharacterized protein n=1 Tax=Cymbomonas tetramitiformis TaxID=36881 RepID=A0AAE0L7G1_9CHLO|nr:hypothetical protein CYMTET_44918 [Cymbomonas tetramitiformis]KAK3274564.1 hypothetical protein CYMTET_17261 [Cymbomonas tetramitiformis]